MPRLSFVCPCYNSINYLERLIDSFLKQDLECEIIFVVDPSSDGTSEYLLSQSERDSRIKTIVNESRAGIMGSRLIGLKEATSPYIAFIDADDWVEPNFASMMVNTLEETGADAVDCPFFVERGKKKGKPSLLKGHYKEMDGHEACKALLNDMVIRGYVWNKVFRKEILEARPFLLIPNFEDMPFIFSMFHKCGKVIHLSTPLYHYFKGDPTSWTHHKNPKRAKQHLISFMSMRHYAEQAGDERLIKICRKAYFRMKLSLLYDLRQSRKDGLGKEEAKRIKKELKIIKRKEPLPFDGTHLYEEGVQASLVKE